MDPEVILIDTDSDNDCDVCNEGTVNGFSVVSKQKKLDETVSLSSSVSLPDLSLSDGEVSISDSATVVPAITAAVEPDRLRISCTSRSPILQKFMKASLLFKEDTVSGECSASGTNFELRKADLDARSASSGGVFDRDNGISDENCDIVKLDCETKSFDVAVDRTSRYLLSEKLNFSAALPDTASKMQLMNGDLKAPRPVDEVPTSSNFKGADSDDDDEDLPSFFGVHRTSKQVHQSSETNGESQEEAEDTMEIVDEAQLEMYPTQTPVSYSIDQLLADHKETVRLSAMVADLQVESSEADDESLSQDDLLPEHKTELERMNVVENKIRDIHPGEKIFIPSDCWSLFSYPDSLTLASCGFRSGQSRTDRQLVTLAPDDLLEFLDPEFIDLVFPAISTKDAFLRFTFYLLSVSPDSRTSRRLHRIVYRVIHGRKSSWTPSTLDICRVFVNYGASLSRLCPDISLLNFKENDLRFMKHETPRRSTENSTSEFELENMKFVLQLLTDALAVRPENYSYSECLALTMILFRVSLDHRLSVGELHVDLEMFFAAVINVIPPENWNDWVESLCRHVVNVTEDHHNIVYLVGLLPLVERGVHLQRVLSLIFMHKYLPQANRFEELLQPKVQHSLNFLETLRFNDKESDFYLTWSLVNLLEYSIGSEALAVEANDFAVLINCLQLKISKIKDYINKIDHILLKDLMVLLVSKWNIMERTFGKKELFASGSGPVMVQSISSQVENESDEEATMDSR